MLETDHIFDYYISCNTDDSNMSHTTSKIISVCVEQHVLRADLSEYETQHVVPNATLSTIVSRLTRIMGMAFGPTRWSRPFIGIGTRISQQSMEDNIFYRPNCVQSSCPTNTLKALTITFRAVKPLISLTALITRLIS